MTCRKPSGKCTKDVCYCPQYNLERFINKPCKHQAKLDAFGKRYGASPELIEQTLSPATPLELDRAKDYAKQALGKFK